MQKNIKISEIMTKNPVSIKSMDSIHLAYEILEKKLFRHLPVVNSTGMIVGIISDRDARNIKVAIEMVDNIFEHENKNMKSTLTIEEVMSKSPSCISQNASIFDACQQMVETRVGALPIVENLENKKLVGIVSYIDLLKWYSLN